MTTHIGSTGLARLLGDWATGTGSVTSRLATSVSDLLLDGRLPTGVRLPAERDLAAQLGVSRTTVTAAYASLRDRGFLVSRQGAGSWTKLPPDVARRPRGLSPTTTAGDVIDLGVASPAAPTAALAVAVQEAAEQLPRHVTGHGYAPAGLPDLRAAVAERYCRRGLPTDPEHVVITSGAQSALALLARVLLRPRDAVLVENPTYPNARDALLAAGARLLPVGVDPEGLDADDVVEALTQSRPRAAYLIPDFHNPTGTLLDEAGRGALVRAARVTGTQLVVDETMVDLVLDEVPVPPPVAALAAPDAPVLSVGSLSKSFWGGLRIGWVRGPRAVAATLAAARPSFDLSTPVLDQLVATALLAREAELVAARRDELRTRRDVLAAELATRLPSWRFVLPPGGLSLWVALEQPDATRLAALARRAGVHVVPGPDFGLHGTLERFLRLPYALPEPVLREAVARLALADAELRRAAPTPEAGLLTA
ncbi:MAG: PLP-dependent aminotransferase family protein [Actinomycetota bacterium]|nr:PLP-dependent aminotransferase family protein [Actinomycetota bacterium]